MMPGTADGLASNETLRQRPAVVSARRSNRQYVAAAPHKQNGFVSDMPEQHLAIHEPLERHPLAEVRAWGR
jgi:hypothetical protein